MSTSNVPESTIRDTQSVSWIHPRRKNEALINIERDKRMTQATTNVSIVTDSDYLSIIEAYLPTTISGPVTPLPAIEKFRKVGERSSVGEEVLEYLTKFIDKNYSEGCAEISIMPSVCDDGLLFYLLEKGEIHVTLLVKYHARGDLPGYIQSIMEGFVTTNPQSYFNTRRLSLDGTTPLQEIIANLMQLRGETEISTPDTCRFKFYYYDEINRYVDNRTIVKDYDTFNDTHDFLYHDIDLNKLLDSYFDSRESILILTGEPGVGKTQLLKALIAGFRLKGVNSAWYVKDSRVLEDEKFWMTVIDHNPELLILDDMDQELKPRYDSEDGNSIVNKLLSVSDGVVSIDTKIVVTTNLTDPIDKAIVRPGRCFDILRIHALTVEQARECWIKLEMDPATFDSTFEVSLNPGSISQAKLMSEVEKVRAASAPYLLNKEASRRIEYQS